MTEPAIKLVRKLVGHRRSYGIKSRTAMADVAPELGISPWRVQTLYARLASMCPVLLSEWERLRVRGASMLRAEAVRLRRMADELEAEADYQSRQSEVARCDAALGEDVPPEATD
jgi:hypothetical protein